MALLAAAQYVMRDMHPKGARTGESGCLQAGSPSHLLFSGDFLGLHIRTVYVLQQGVGVVLPDGLRQASPVAYNRFSLVNKVFGLTVSGCCLRAVDQLWTEAAHW